MKFYFSLSKHAKERIIERSFDHIMQFYLNMVFKCGQKLNEEEIKINFDKAIDNQRYFVREYRKYAGFIYIFGGKSESKKFILYRLITVIPLVK